VVEFHKIFYRGGGNRPSLVTANKATGPVGLPQGNWLCEPLETRILLQGTSKNSFEICPTPPATTPAVGSTS